MRGILKASLAKYMWSNHTWKLTTCLLAWHFTRTSCLSLQTMKHLQSHKNWEVDWAGTEATFFHWSSLPALWSLYTSHRSWEPVQSDTISKCPIIWVIWSSFHTIRFWYDIKWPWNEMKHLIPQSISGCHYSCSTRKESEDLVPQ